MKPLISIIHPTRRTQPSEAFPRGWKAVHDLYLERADHPESIEYVLSVHESRWNELDGLMDGFPERWNSFRVVMNTQRDCSTDNLNNAAAHSTGLLIHGVADDMEPPEHWDTLLLGSLAIADVMLPYPVVDVSLSFGEALEQEAIIHCSTGASIARDRELMNAGAITRKRYERYGWIVDPEFESMFGDNYFTFLARQDAEAGLCKIVERLDIVFEHKHPIFGKGLMDEAYEQENNAAAYRQGQATFMRKAFGTQVLYACCPGDWFQAEWVWPMFDLLLQLNGGNRFMVAPIGGHTSNVYCTRYEMAESALTSTPAPDLVLWVDDDNVLTFDQFNLLYQDLLDHPELSGVTGWCWCDNDGRPDPQTGKPRPWMMSVGRQGAALECHRMTIEDLRKAKESGTHLITSDDLEPHAFWSGFPVVLMRGAALRELGQSAFAPIVADVKFGFTGEDTSFFVNARKAGQKWAVDLRVKVPHVKPRAIEPYQMLTAENQAEYLESKGLKVVPLSSAAD